MGVKNIVATVLVLAGGIWLIIGITDIFGKNITAQSPCVFAILFCLLQFRHWAAKKHRPARSVVQAGRSSRRLFKAEAPSIIMSFAARATTLRW
jgi:hypothetical protein